MSLDDAHTLYRVTWFPWDRKSASLTTTDKTKALACYDEHYGEAPMIEARDLTAYAVIYNPVMGIDRLEDH